MMKRPFSIQKIWQPEAKRSEQGAVMAIVLMLMALLFIVGWVLISLSLMEGQIAANDVEMIQAFYVAEGAIHIALNQLNQGVTPSTSGSIGAGQYSLSCTDVPPPTALKRIDAYGYIPSQASARAVKRITVLVNKLSPFQLGAFGDNALDMSGGAIADSYDSDLGAYGGSNVGSNGDVGSNGNITLSGSGTQVLGDATAGGAVNNPSQVTGVVTNGAPPTTLQDVNCPAGGYTPAASIPSGPNINYNATTGDLNVSSGTNLTLNPGSYYLHSLSLTGGSTLTAAAGGAVIIYIDGTLSASGGALVNPSAIPANLQIYGCGTDNSPWSLSGGSSSYLAIYAPNHRVTLSGGSVMYGSVIGYEVVNTGGGYFHYDEALARIPGIDPYEIVPRSWTELNP